MEKKKIYGETLKEQLLASARDRLCIFVMAGNTVRGAILNGTRMVNEMRANHGLGILETLVLGRAYLGAGLMTANLKGAERLSISISCSGPVKGLVVEANAWICSNAVLYNCRIGTGAVVAAGCVVRSRDVPAHTMVEGNPAVVVAEFDSGLGCWCHLAEPYLLPTHAQVGGHGPGLTMEQVQAEFE